jgi:hypothetical protein
MSNEESTELFKKLYALLKAARSHENTLRVELANVFHPTAVNPGNEGLIGQLTKLEAAMKLSSSLELQVVRVQQFNTIERQDEAHHAQVQEAQNQLTPDASKAN